MNIYPEASAPPFDYHSYHTSTTEQPLYLHPEYRNLYILRSQQTYEQIETEYDEYEQREAIYTFLGAVILSIIFFLCVPFTACIPYLLMLKFNNTRQPVCTIIDLLIFTLDSARIKCHRMDLVHYVCFDISISCWSLWHFIVHECEYYRTTALVVLKLVFCLLNLAKLEQHFFTCQIF